MRIPVGTVTTYAMLAGFIGCASPRAVGQALRRNPFAPRVPCHRVVASDLSVGGFCGRKDGRAVRRKRQLLSSEGIRFKNGKIVQKTGKEVFNFREAI